MQVSVLGTVSDIDEALLCSLVDHPAPFSIVKTFLRELTPVALSGLACGLVVVTARTAANRRLLLLILVAVIQTRSIFGQL